MKRLVALLALALLLGFGRPALAQVQDCRYFCFERPCERDCRYFCLCAPETAPGPSFPSGATSYWRHEEASGNGDRADAIDTKPLLATGNLVQIAGKIGNATQTVATVGYLDGSGGIGSYTSALTFTTWLKNPTGSTGSFSEISARWAALRIQLSPTTLSFVGLDIMTGDPLTCSGCSASLADNTWAFTCLRWSTSTKQWTVRWYGASDGNATNHTTDAAYLGSAGDAWAVFGVTFVPSTVAKTAAFDEQGFWPLTLTDEQCDALYNEGTALPLP
jgi:hypothetical protein